MLSEIETLNPSPKHCEFVSGFSLPKPNGTSARQGINYEKKLKQKLMQRFAAKELAYPDFTPFFRNLALAPLQQNILIHNPCLRFWNNKICIPDFILLLNHSFVPNREINPISLLCLEAKLTWVPEAKPKLEQLYLPSLRSAIEALSEESFKKENSCFEKTFASQSLVICKKLTSEAPPAGITWNEGLELGLLHWNGNGAIP